MSKGNTTENDILEYIFKDTAFSWDANTDLYLSLHTADPGEAGDQTTNECTYGSYARVGVARSAGGWTISGATASNTALAQFPECTSGSETITYVSIGMLSSGASVILYSGALTASRSVSSGIQPQFSALSLVVTED